MPGIGQSMLLDSMYDGGGRYKINRYIFAQLVNNRKINLETSNTINFKRKLNLYGSIYILNFYQVIMAYNLK